MTAVPKPLKFLRPHYESLEKAYASWPQGENKVRHHKHASVVPGQTNLPSNPSLICCPCSA